jgi:hypothetical protein
MPSWSQNRFTSKCGSEFSRIRLYTALILTTLSLESLHMLRRFNIQRRIRFRMLRVKDR